MLFKHVYTPFCFEKVCVSAPPCRFEFQAIKSMEINPQGEKRQVEKNATLLLPQEEAIHCIPEHCL